MKIIEIEQIPIRHRRVGHIALEVKEIECIISCLDAAECPPDKPPLGKELAGEFMTLLKQIANREAEEKNAMG